MPLTPTEALKSETTTPTLSSTAKKNPSSKQPSFGELTDVVTFIVGPSKKKFVVHKSFACHYSPVFKAAFNVNGEFIEGQTQTYILPDTTEGAFELLVEWIYTQRLEDNGDGSNGVNGSSLTWLWILAEKLHIPRLQNVTVDLLECIRSRRKTLSLNVNKLIYQTTSRGNALRRLVLHQCVWNLHLELFHRRAENFPKEMLLEIATVFAENRENGATYSRNMADYHVKEDEEA